MKRTIFFILFLSVSIAPLFAQKNDSTIIRSIFEQELSKGKAYELLTRLCTDIGPRLSGSDNAARSVEWCKKMMENYEFDRVFLQEVMVPHWVRGEKEKANIIYNNKSIDVPVCALGGSVGTGKLGLRSQVIEVKTFEELATLGRKKVAGKLVFFNRPMDPTKINTFEAYGGAVNQRGSGAVEAAKYGAIGVIVRSMTLASDDYPHTGAMRPYVDSLPKIPACAISTNAADLLSAMMKSNPDLEFYFKMSCETLPDVKSYNVVGEIKGTELPDEIIVVGGHLDSWDLGQGAHDDGAGVMQSLEALRLLKSLNIRPKRTIRAVMFMNEENGLRGGIKYAELAKANKDNHIAAIESDEGGFVPRGFGMDMPIDKMEKIRSWKKLFEPYGILQFPAGHGGADIGPLKEQGVPQISLIPDSQRYFDFHHAATDKILGVNKRELEMGTAALTSLLYLLSEYGL